MEDIKRIRVGGDSVGILGFEETMKSVLEEHADKDDEALMTILVEKFSRRNYIAPSARDEYAKALLREFKKFAGLPYDEETPEAKKGIEIKVLGPGCAACDTLMNLLTSLLSELDLPANLEHVKDIKEIGKYGVLGTPALVINGKVMAVGKTPPRATLKQWLQNCG